MRAPSPTSPPADNEQPGPNNANPGYSPLLNAPIAAYGGLTYYDLLGFKGLTPNTEPATGTMPGGGQIGAVLFNARWIKAGSVDSTGSYNHYSALRTFEDLLGITAAARTTAATSASPPPRPTSAGTYSTSCRCGTSSPRRGRWFPWEPTAMTPSASTFS